MLGSSPLGAQALAASVTPPPVNGSLTATLGVMSASFAGLATATGILAASPAPSILIASCDAVATGVLAAALQPATVQISATSSVFTGSANLVADPIIATSYGSSLTQPPSLRATADYLAFIAPEHTGKPKFAATVGLSVDPLARMQLALRKLAITDFDLDTAIGVQLDAVGVRVGRSRLVPYPLQGLFFSLDDPTRGLDQGIWKGPFDTGSSTYQLDDDTYRRLLRAKVLANLWDGTLDDLEAIYAAYFIDPATLIFLSDDAVSAQPDQLFSLDDPLRGLDQAAWASSIGEQDTPDIASVDMRMTVGFAGKIPSAVDLSILNQHLVGAKPEGVTVDYAVTSVDGGPMFGLDVENECIAGLDQGAWAVTPSALIGAVAAI